MHLNACNVPRNAQHPILQLVFLNAPCNARDTWNARSESFSEAIQPAKPARFFTAMRASSIDNPPPAPQGKDVVFHMSSCECEFFFVNSHLFQG
jgi:hypothetical protein